MVIQKGKTFFFSYSFIFTIIELPKSLGGGGVGRFKRANVLSKIVKKRRKIYF